MIQYTDLKCVSYKDISMQQDLPGFESNYKITCEYLTSFFPFKWVPKT
jgi:hypothetical protein